MPNYQDREPRHSSPRHERSGASSGWRSARSSSDRSASRDGYGRDNRRDYKRGRDGDRQRDDRQRWGRDNRRDGHGRDDRRNGYRDRDDRREYGRGEHKDGYKRRDDNSDGQKRFSDRREGSKRYWDSERNTERRDAQRRDDRREYGRGRDGDRQRDDRQRWGRDNRRGDKRDSRREERSGSGRGFDRRHETPRRYSYADDGYRNVRGGEEKRARAKELQQEIPDSITPDMLPEQTYNHLRGLNKDNAYVVARHLAYAAEMMDIDPEVSYQHAQAAYARAARIDIVREALGIAAYVTGRYAQALTELRAYRRFSNDYSHVAMEADAERGLGRSEKALRFISEIPLDRLNPAAKVELAIVTSGAKADVGDSEGGLRLMEKIIVANLDEELAARVELVKADRLEELGRADEAQAIRAQWEPLFAGEADDSDILLDLADVYGDMNEYDRDDELADSEEDTPDESADADESADDERDESDKDPSDNYEDERAQSEQGEADETGEADPDVSLVEELKEELGDDFSAEEWTDEFSDSDLADFADEDFSEVDDEGLGYEERESA